MKKIKINKKLLTFGLLGIFALALVSAALITHFAVIKQEVNVEQSIKVNGFDEDTLIENVYEVYNGWEQKYTSKANVLTNDADRDIAVVISTTDKIGITTTYDTVGLSTTWSSDVDANADASLSEGVVTLIANEHEEYFSDASEARITIDASDVGVETLSDLETISWDVNVVTGYLPHVDVLIDTTNDGIADDALVFEYANVNYIPGEYPMGSLNTFGVRGIVDLDANAWLSSGPPGGPEIILKTLSKWITDEDYKVIRFEIEVDAWEQIPGVTSASAEISNIMINGNAKEINTFDFDSTQVLESGYKDTFYINTVFDEMIPAGQYDLYTTVDLV